MRNFSISGVDVEKWGWRRYHLRIYILFLHTWSGSKGNISITCNWAPLTDNPNCSYNYMFWLLTRGRYSALSSEKVISHTCPSGFICISFRFFCQSQSHSSVPVPDLVSSVALESVATFRLLAKCFYCADRGPILQVPRANSTYGKLCELCMDMRLTPTEINEILETVWKFRFLVPARQITL